MKENQAECPVCGETYHLAYYHGYADGFITCRCLSCLPLVEPDNRYKKIGPLRTSATVMFDINLSMTPYYVPSGRAFK